MSDGVKPALTPEEWEYLETAQRTGRDGRDTLFVYIASEEADGRWVPAGTLGVGWNGDDVIGAGSAARHALAALALYDQPFGFTRDDVDLVRRLDTLGRKHDDEHAEDLADRIAALLPPEGSATSGTQDRGSRCPIHGSGPSVHAVDFCTCEMGRDP